MGIMLVFKDCLKKMVSEKKGKENGICVSVCVLNKRTVEG